jgi:hypothetical protein
MRTYHTGLYNSIIYIIPTALSDAIIRGTVLHRGDGSSWGTVLHRGDGSSKGQADMPESCDLLWSRVMKYTNAWSNIFIPITAILSGIILFLTFAAVFVSSTIFNDSYHIDMLTRLDLPNHIAETAMIKSSEIFAEQEQITTYINSNLSSELIDTNIKSIVKGLLDYIKGKTNTLPDLYLRTVPAVGEVSAGKQPDTGTPVEDKKQTDTEKLLSSPFSKLSAIEKINLRLLAMFSDEQKIGNILLLISKVQFVAKNIILPLILLYWLIVILLLQNKPSAVPDYFMCSILCCAVLSLSSCVILGRLCNIDLHSIPGLQNIPFPEIREILSSYVLSFLSNLMHTLFINSFILILGAALIYFIARISIKSTYNRRWNMPVSEELSPFEETSPFEELSLKNTSHRKVSSIMYHSLTVVMMIVLCIHINFAANEYLSIGLKRTSEYQTLSTSLEMITDARDHEICYLEVIILDCMSQEPLEGAEIIVSRADSIGTEEKRSTTGSDGASPFLLEKGSYRLMLDTTGTQANWSILDTLYLDISLLRPGKNELKIIAEKQENGHIHIQSSAIQYIP